MKELYGDVPVDQWRDSMNRYKEAILAEEKESTKARFARFTKGAEAAHLPNRISLLFFPRKIATYFELEKMPSTFDIIVAGDQVKQGKPDPEIFDGLSSGEGSPKRCLSLRRLVCRDSCC